MSLAYTGRVTPTGARRRPTNQRAVNGSRPVPLFAGFRFARNSPQPPQNSFGKTADVLKFRAMVRLPDLSAMTGGGRDFPLRSPPFFFPLKTSMESA